MISTSTLIYTGCSLSVVSL